MSPLKTVLDPVMGEQISLRVLRALDWQHVTVMVPVVDYEKLSQTERMKAVFHHEDGCYWVPQSMWVPPGLGEEEAECFVGDHADWPHTANGVPDLAGSDLWRQELVNRLLAQDARVVFTHEISLLHCQITLANNQLGMATIWRDSHYPRTEAVALCLAIINLYGGAFEADKVATALELVGRRIFSVVEGER